MAIYDKWCKSQNCPNYKEWSFGYGVCISCTLQGESEHIENIAKDCPRRHNLLDNSEYDYGHNVPSFKDQDCD